MKSNLTPLGPKADKDTVRRSNLSLVLRAVRDEGEGEATRAGVAARVGLTRSPCPRSSSSCSTAGS